MNFRTNVIPEDIKHVRSITESTKFFYDHEVDVAVSLVEEALKDGEEALYHFLFVEDNNKTIGYTSYGEIPCTKGRYDVYWIVVSDEYRGKGIGKLLLKETENQIIILGGEIAYLETSSQEKYIPTCKFYENLLYHKEAVIKDFYTNDDDKIIYSKRLQKI